MKINLDNIDRTQFIVREEQIAGETVYLVFPPHIGTTWNKHNLIFRSSVWNADGELISASYKKFFNWGEQPDLAHTPFSTKANGGIDCMEKMDGSTLIVSKYKGVLITRTRGTVDATSMENGHEIQYFMQKYNEFFDYLQDEADATLDVSFIFEWESPENKIVLNHSDADLVLTGVIDHSDYSLWTQATVDAFAACWNFRRPRRFHYEKIAEMLDDVKTWEGTEGICVYSKNGQEIRKVKSDWYLALHRMKSELGSFGRVVDAFFVMDMPKYQDFYNQICEVYDFEIAERCRPQISKICDAWKEVEKIVYGMEKFLNERLATVSTNGGFRDIRKKQAELVFGSYGKTNRSNFLFKLLDGNDLDKDDYKKLLYQVVKEPEEKDA